MGQQDSVTKIVVDASVLERGSSMAYLHTVLNFAGFQLTNCEFIAATTGYDKPTEADFRRVRAKIGDAKAVLALGNNAAYVVGASPGPTGVTKLRGRAIEIEPAQTAFVSVSPGMVLRDLTMEPQFVADVRFAGRWLKGDRELLPPVEIVDIRGADDVTRLIDEVCAANPADGKPVAYDFETTGLDRRRDIVVSGSFCTGWTGRAYRVFYFRLYDEEFVPLFGSRKQAAIEAEFTRFFQMPQAAPSANQEGFYRIVWNGAFDDWMASEWLGVDVEPSVWDAQIEKYALDTDRPHDLKSAFAVFCGYPNYDRDVGDAVAEIAKRRQRLLVEHADFAALEFYGAQPEKRPRGFAWPKELNKKVCAYVQIPADMLRTYACVDAVATLMLHDTFHPRISDPKEELYDVCRLRHRSNVHLWRCERRGQLLDEKANRDMSAFLTGMERTVHERILAEVDSICERTGLKLGLGSEEFNPASNQQVAKVLYGFPEPVPALDRKRLLKTFDFDDILLEEVCEAVETYVYRSYKKVRELLRAGAFNAEEAAEFLIEAYQAETEERFGRAYPEPPLAFKLVGTGGLLYDPVTLTKKGQPGCGKAALMTLYKRRPSDFLSLVLMHRKASKMRSSFIDKIYAAKDENGLVRTSYNINGTNSGRISSSGAYNAQNWPKYIRGQIVPRPGYGFLDMDFKNIEVRGMAAFSQDPSLLHDIYATDPHRVTAARIFNKPEAEITDAERNAGKIARFLSLYGGGAQKLADALGISVALARQIVNDLNAAYPDVARWMQRQVAIAHQGPNYYVKTAFGTRRSTRNVLSTDPETRRHIERVAVNSPIQGSAGEYTLWFADKVLEEAARRGVEMWFNGTVHDSIQWEVPLASVQKKQIGEAKGKPVFEIVGAPVDVLHTVRDTPTGSAVWDSVRYDFDIELNMHWSGAPDVRLALDTRDVHDAFRWDLVLDEDEDGEVRFASLDKKAIEVAIS